MPEPSPLAKALAALQQQLPKVDKTKTATVVTDKAKYSYQYADLADITRELLPILGELGLSFVSAPTLTAEGKFVLRYRLLHADGESLDGEYPLPTSGTPQAVGSAITYARRYALCALTGLAAEADDDGAHAQASAREQRAARRATQPTPTPTEQAPSSAGMSDGQRRHMMALFRELGFHKDDRESRMEYVVEAVNRPEGAPPITSSSDLTSAEASKVIDKLTRWRDQDQPPPDIERQAA